MARLKALSAKGGVKAGILEGAVNKFGTDVLDYAPRMEFGGGGIPPHPFMRETYRKNRHAWVEKIGKMLGAGRDASVILGFIGDIMRDNIQTQIMSNMPPENSEKWRKYKQKHAAAVADQTLQYTGAMLHAIDREVIE